jgi:hypothetical protein
VNENEGGDLFQHLAQKKTSFAQRGKGRHCPAQYAVIHTLPRRHCLADVVSFYHLGVIVSTFDHNLRVAGNGEQIADGTVPIRRDIPSDGVTLSYHVVFTLRAMISTPFIHPCRA